MLSEKFIDIEFPYRKRYKLRKWMRTIVAVADCLPQFFFFFFMSHSSCAHLQIGICESLIMSGQKVDLGLVVTHC